MKYIKLIILILIVSLLFILIAINYTNINFSKEYISQLVHEKTGRQLNINGSLKLKLFPQPGVIVDDIQFENAVWSDHDYMLEAKLMDIQLSLKALFYGQIEISRIKLDGIIVNIESNDLNKSNWNIITSETKNNLQAEGRPEISSKKLPLDLKAEIILTNIKINYKNKDSVNSILIKNLLIKNKKNTQIKLVAVYNGLDIYLNIQSISLNNILSLEKIPVEASGKIGNIDLDINLEIATNKNTAKEVDFDIKFNDLSTLEVLTQRKLAKIKDVSIKAKLVVNDNSIILKIDKGMVEGSQYEGEVKYSTLGDRPKINARLNITSLNLDRIEEISKGDPVIKKTQKEVIELFSYRQLPFEYLYKYDADIEVNIKGIDHKILELEEFKIKAQIENGLLNIERLYIKNNRDEKLNAKVRINAQLSSPKIYLNAITENIQLEENDTLKKYLSGAKTNVKINLHSKGMSVHEIMEDLNGQIIVKVGEGKINDRLLKFIGSNILTDLVKAINPVADKSPITNLECAVVRFDIKEGVLVSDKGIVMQTDKIQIISSGIIDLHTETLEFGIRPQAREGVELNLNSLASMVKLSGKITDPSITMSLKDTAVVYSYFATGGATFLVKSLYDTATRDSSPCETAVLGNH
jgi:uncharacterized protein involved in outer membrane biogenesis